MGVRLMIKNQKNLTRSVEAKKERFCKQENNESTRSKLANTGCKNHYKILSKLAFLADFGLNFCQLQLKLSLEINHFKYEKQTDFTCSKGGVNGIKPDLTTPPAMDDLI